MIIEVTWRELNFTGAAPTATTPLVDVVPPGKVTLIFQAPIVSVSELPAGSLILTGQAPQTAVTITEVDEKSVKSLVRLTLVRTVENLFQ